MSLFDKINALGATVVVVTHDLELVHQFDHRIVTIENGKIVSDIPARVHPSYDLPEPEQAEQTAESISSAEEAQTEEPEEVYEGEDDRLDLFDEEEIEVDMDREEEENNG